MAIAALAGLAAALLVLWMPVGLVEMIVASSGLSEAWPAAAPPLGWKARLMMAGFAGVMAIGLVGLARRDADAPEQEDGKGRAHRVQGARKMGFAFSKLTALARGRAASGIEPDAPILRRADAHPDAPSRPPIFASRDFDGIDIFPRAESGRRSLVARRDPERDTIVPLGKLPMPSAPMPLTDAELPQPAFLRPAGLFAVPTLVEDDIDDDGADEDYATFEAAPVAAEWTAPAMPASVAQPAETIRPAPLPMPSTHGLSISELTERLERGLKHRSRKMSSAGAGGGMIADMPVASAVPVRKTVEQDADEALRAALGALRSMTGRR
ncbi:hypothetical protein [Sphingobium cupriresistens]|uniref:Uncharacterized protein n=1 Tax=Sphingobium cupriresistens TaxID=1132417 RepID=A0A8G2DX18_9SPHN|nr:hypothetical protein [Sphingobium cupriresistens]RYM14221.1 hypothetical protein EWH12_03390 [Sphingobium cupriresistens]